MTTGFSGRMSHMKVKAAAERGLYDRDFDIGGTGSATGRTGSTQDTDITCSRGATGSYSGTLPKFPAGAVRVEVVSPLLTVAKAIVKAVSPVAGTYSFTTVDPDGVAADPASGDVLKVHYEARK